jgi:hypothetical protein
MDPPARPDGLTGEFRQRMAREMKPVRDPGTLRRRPRRGSRSTVETNDHGGRDQADCMRADQARYRSRDHVVT